jgi:DNA-binding CsgD family transcriptional regulator
MSPPFSRNVPAGSGTGRGLDWKLEKPLLALHGAMNIHAFWKATQSLLETAMPSYFISAWLRINSTQPLVVLRNKPPEPTCKWLADYFNLHPISRYITQQSGVRIVRISDAVGGERRLSQHAFYRRFMKPENWRYSVKMLFVRRPHRTIAVLGICRTPGQGDFTTVEMKLLRNLYPHFDVALRRIGQIERERVARSAFERFLRHLPLPTILLNWNLRLVYANRAAREFCAAWKYGPEAARNLTCEGACIPAEILRECEGLKELYREPMSNDTPSMVQSTSAVHSSSWPNLRAMIQVERLGSAAVARPHFLLQFQDLRGNDQTILDSRSTRLANLAYLTSREGELANLVREGHSNQEIAERVRCSLPTVKKHLHSIFNKLEVPSRSRLMALLR